MKKHSKNSTSNNIPRIGLGYDVHQFAQRRKLILGGVRIPHSAGLDGHSDADVLLHAICDALLGAAGLPDIGKQFPNTSKKYKNISSIILLRTVAHLLKKEGMLIGNVDSMVILQSPKIGEYIPSMKKKISKALGIPLHSISIKATTNEHLGFIGREEGCAALATTLIIHQ
ncbi:MAG: 2-C-methyl-D-erythritol 2,4-cyclodiphosphate synthase [bacterium]